MTPEQEIKEFATQRGAELVGIASVEDINRYAPIGYRPDDILRGAKSVIVVAGRPLLSGAWRSPDHRAIPSNFDFSRIRAGITTAVAKFIESKYGYYALADIPANTGFNASLSFKLCAEMAGLGTRSLAGGVVLNRELGIINLAVCITTMPLKPDGPLQDLVCPDKSCVKMWGKKGTTPCLEACPECLSGELEGDKIKWMRFDRRICSTRAQNLGPFSFERLLMEAAREPDPEKRRSMMLGSFSRSALQAVAFASVVAQCFECLRNCPICIRARTLKAINEEKDTGEAVGKEASHV